MNQEGLQHDVFEKMNELIEKEDSVSQELRNVVDSMDEVRFSSFQFSQDLMRCALARNDKRLAYAAAVLLFDSGLVDEASRQEDGSYVRWGWDDAVDWADSVWPIMVTDYERAVDAVADEMLEELR